SPFFLLPPRPHPPLHSFPTRRSSDLKGFPSFTTAAHELVVPRSIPMIGPVGFEGFEFGSSSISSTGCRAWGGGAPRASVGRGSRSEEHTSELQSQSNLVCRLLLEKKK